MIKRWYRDLRQFFVFNFNKHLLTNIKGAFKFRPFDYSFFYDRQLEYLETMLDYFKSSEYIGEAYKDKIVNNIKLAIYLLNIGYKDGLPTEIIRRADHTCEIRCNKKVNRRNIERFFPNLTDRQKDMIENYDIYETKARHLYHKILLYKSAEWWD